MNYLSDTPEGRELAVLIRIYVWRELPEVAAGEKEGAMRLDQEMQELLNSYVN